MEPFRRPVTRAGYKEQGGRREVSATATVVLCLLLALPAMAAVRLAQTIDGRWVIGYALLISLVTYFLYWHDKQSARAGEWRTSEATLHFFELLGGWPGAFVAQRAVRHKISKVRYQITFWLIILLHEGVAFDFTQNWQISKKVFSHSYRNQAQRLLQPQRADPRGRKMLETNGEPSK